MKSWHILAVLGCIILAAAGCKKEEAAEPQAPAAAGQAEQPQAGAATAITPEARKKAEEIFSSRCTPCHGPEGAGDGPASKGLTPPPRNFHDPAWQSSVTDEHIEKIIQYGGAAVGKSPAMPGNPDITPDVAAALRAHIRDLGKK